MNENSLDRVGVERGGPAFREHVEENFHGFAGLQSNLILRVVESLKDICIEVDEVFLVALGANVLEQVTHGDSSSESQVITPVIVHAPFNFSAAFFEVCVHLGRRNQVLIDKLHKADEAGLTDFSRGASTLPAESREEDHLEDNLTVKL